MDYLFHHLNSTRIPATIEVRYYREEELDQALRPITLLKSMDLHLKINEPLKKCPAQTEAPGPAIMKYGFPGPGSTKYFLCHRRFPIDIVD